MDKQQLKELIGAAEGRLPFDNYFYNAKIVDVYRERIIENGSVGVKNGRIAALCPEFEPRSAQNTDCGRMYLAPSFIDAHMHIESSKLTPFAYCEGAVPHGTGCIFFDPMQMSYTLGLPGIEAMCEMLEKMPLESYLQLSSQLLTTLKNVGDITDVLKCCKAKTVGEISGGELDDESIQLILEAAEKAEIAVNGHCPSMGHDDISGAVCASLRDDHECESFEELEDRLSCGMAAFIREGTIEPNCRLIAKGIAKSHIPTDNIMFCTDDKSAEDILENGCIDKALRIAVKSGIDPVTAVRMATLNTARHYGIEHIIGSVTPSRKANLILLDSLETFTVKKVYHDGRLVAENGVLLSPKKFYAQDYPKLRDTVVLPKGLDAHSFEVRIKDVERVEVNVIEMPEGGITTKLSRAELDVSEGVVCGDTQKDILPVFVTERFGKSGSTGCGFMKGLGIKKGAVAASFAQESNNIVVSGADPEDMLCAVRYLERSGGGAAVSINGKVVGFHPLPVAGILSDKSIRDEIAVQRDFRKALSLTGGNADTMAAVLTVSLCRTIPDVGLTEKGLYDVERQCYIPAVIGGDDK